jgi:putative redox protein
MRTLISCYVNIGYDRRELTQRSEAARMVEATALPVAWQVGFRAGDNEGRADTVKDGAGGSAGLRPHELLEAALATCMTISARMALAQRGAPQGEVRVRVRLEREQAATRFRYELILETALEPHRAAVMDCIERSPVRATLSQQLIFEPG